MPIIKTDAAGDAAKNNREHIQEVKARQAARRAAAEEAAAQEQAAVQEPAAAVSPEKIEEIAREVIAGKWSSGAERVEKLKAAGYDPDAVQKCVNQLLK